MTGVQWRMVKGSTGIPKAHGLLNDLWTPAPTTRALCDITADRGSSDDAWLQAGPRIPRCGQCVRVLMNALEEPNLQEFEKVEIVITAIVPKDRIEELAKVVLDKGAARAIFREIEPPTVRIGTRQSVHKIAPEESS